MIKRRHQRAVSGWGLLVPVVALMLALAINSTGAARAHDLPGTCEASGIGIAIRGEVQGTNTAAAFGYAETSPLGATTVEYQITVELSASQCPITGGEPELTLPDGTVIDLDDDLALDSGESVTYDVTGSPYSINSADLGNVSGAGADEVRASATVDADSHRDSGVDQDVSAATNWDILVINPSTTVTVTGSSTSAVSGETVTWTVTEENDGDVNLETPFVNIDASSDDDDDGDVQVLSGPPDSGDDGDGVLEPGEVWSWSFTANVTSDTTLIATGHGTDPLGSDITADNFESERDSASVTVTSPDGIGQQGCSPGFWKNHTDVWAVNSPDDALEDVFEAPDSLGVDEATLLEALRFGGGGGAEGGARILLRASAASLLNAVHADVAFNMSEGDVISEVNSALASEDRGTMLELADELDAANNLGCGIDAHGNPIEPESE